MINHGSQPQSLHPFEVVRSAFVYFNEPPQGAIDKEELVRIMIASRCPSQRIAHNILDRMVEAGLLKRHTDPQTGDSYSRTELGIFKTPKLTLPPSHFDPGLN